MQSPYVIYKNNDIEPSVLNFVDIQHVRKSYSENLLVSLHLCAANVLMFLLSYVAPFLLLIASIV